MKQIQSKSLLTLVIILIIIGISTTSATRFMGASGKVKVGDSTLKVDTIDSEQDFYVIDNPNRVRYPAILREHRNESKDYIKKYLKREREYVAWMFRKGKNYMPVARDIFDRYGVPHEFQVLPALESNFKATAVSPVGAVGYWQFMPRLAKEYGLKISGANDERKNFHKSTVAASKFIRDQLKEYNNDPLLVVAAYNAGPGRVNYAIRKSGAKEYWKLQHFLPAETRRFVLQFLALNVVAMNYDKFLANTMDFEAPATLQIANIDSMKKQFIDEAFINAPTM